MSTNTVTYLDRGWLLASVTHPRIPLNRHIFGIKVAGVWTRLEFHHTGVTS